MNFKSFDISVTLLHVLDQGCPTFGFLGSQLKKNLLKEFYDFMFGRMWAAGWIGPVIEHILVGVTD